MAYQNGHASSFQSRQFDTPGQSPAILIEQIPHSADPSPKSWGSLFLYVLTAGNTNKKNITKEKNSFKTKKSEK